MATSVTRDCPTLKELQNATRHTSVATRWYNLGLQLLDSNTAVLDVIKTNHQRDDDRCTEMFKTWLEMKPGASWSHLVTALKRIGLTTVARNIQHRRVSKKGAGTAPTRKPEAGITNKQISTEEASIEFGILLTEILEELKKNESKNLELLKTISSTLTIKDKSGVRMFSDSELDGIRACNDTDTLLVVKLRHCYRWDDHSMLTFLMTSLNAEKCLNLLQKFQIKVYSKTRLQQIHEQCLKEKRKFPEGYHKMVAIVENKMFSSITKEEYDELKQFIADHCGVEPHVMSPLSKVAPFSSIIIEWFIPVNAVSYMIRTAKASIYKLTEKKVVYLKMSSTVIFDQRNNKSECDQLLEAAEKGDAATVERLINIRYIDVNTTEDVVKKTALHHASWNGNVQVVELLIRSGSDVRALDWRSTTALQCAIERKHVQLVEMLINHGANVNALDLRKMTVLHHAAKKGPVQVVETLIRSGANVKALDKENETPLHHAARKGHIQIVMLLIHFGADVNAVDVKGRTPLHLALKHGKRDVVQCIVNEPRFDTTCLDQATQIEISRVLEQSQSVEQIVSAFPKLSHTSSSWSSGYGSNPSSSTTKQNSTISDHTSASGNGASSHELEMKQREEKHFIKH